MPKFLILSLLKFYKKNLSGLFPPTCRFTPTCSQYMIEAVEKYGCVKGILLGIKRIIRCNPFCKGGYDPLL